MNLIYNALMWISWKFINAISEWASNYLFLIDIYFSDWSPELVWPEAGWLDPVDDEDDEDWHTVAVFTEEIVSFQPQRKNEREHGS